MADWKSTAWEDRTPQGDVVRVTIEELLKIAPAATPISTSKLAAARIEPESWGRMMQSDTQYPILVLRHPDQTLQILDGNHRLAKAIHTDQPTVMARIIEYDWLDPDQQWLFRR